MALLNTMNWAVSHLASRRVLPWFISLFYLKFFLQIFIYFRELGGEGQGERNITMREKNQSVASWTCSDQEPNPQPRHVPWPGIEPETFLGWCPTNWATLVRATPRLLVFLDPKIFLSQPIFKHWDPFVLSICFSLSNTLRPCYLLTQSYLHFGLHF